LYTLSTPFLAGKGAGAPVTSLDPKGEEFTKLKERILLLERVILHTIGFELSVDHPYKFLVEQIKKLIHTRQLEYITPPKNLTSSQIMSKMLNELVQYSMNFANDSVHTSLCLQFSPQLIATSCVYLAGHFAKVQTTNNKKTWLEILTACPPAAAAQQQQGEQQQQDAEALCSICGQIIELIVDRRGTTTDVKAFENIRANLERLKEAAATGQGGAGPGGAVNRPVRAPPSPRPPPPPGGKPPPPPAAAAAPSNESAAKRQRTS
jgi:hypothetical protein